MSSAEQGNRSSKLPHASFWIRELPFSLVLVLTVLGVAYTTVSKQPIIVYWELLAPVIALVCVGAGWPSGDEYDVVDERSKNPQRQRDRALHSHVIGARHLHRWRSCPFLASLSSGAHHGALRSGGCMD